MRTYFIILLLLITQLSFSQEIDLDTNPYGIFDAVADWGTEEFPPKLGKNKVPGKVEVTIDDDDWIYDVYGNGDDIWFQRDEGIYVYTMKQGSWSLSAQVKWIASGRDQSLLKGHRQEANVQIRSVPASTSSPNFRLYLRSGTFGLYGGNAVTGWRLQDLALSTSWWNLTPDGKYVFANEEGLYMRVTRVEAMQYVYTEWSHDGSQWFFGYGKTIEMPHEVGYGLSVTNTADNTKLAQAQFSQVSLVPAPPIATRLLSQDQFEPNAQVQITLSVINPTKSNQTIELKENFPEQWTFIDANFTPQLDNHSLVWNVEVEPGQTWIHYTVRAPPENTGHATFNGSINHLTTLGSAEILNISISVKDFVASSMYRGVFAIAPLIMFFLHMSLYLFNPKLIQNLYYSLFLMSISIVIYLVMGNVNSVSEIHHYSAKVTFIFAFSNCMFLLFLYSLVYPKLPKQFWVFAAVFMSLGLFIQATFATHLLMTFNILYSIGVVESYRIVFVGLRKKIEGFQIIAVGMFAYGFAWFWAYINTGIEIPSPTFLTLPVSFLLLLLCMSIYLSFWFTRINRDLEKLTVELEERVESRTRDISDTNAMLKVTVDQLAEARDESEAANQAKSQFLARMSHEIRTPLTGLLGMSELLQSTSLNSKQKTFLQSIRISGESLLGIINEILDFSKIEANRIQLDINEMDLYKTLGEIISSLRGLAGNKNLELQWRYDDDVPRIIFGDAMRLKQIFSNLLGNAIKFTPQGYVSLSVTIINKRHDKPTFQFTVKDTGIGIPEHAQETIFDAFAQGDESTTRKFGGTGLGLAIVKHLIQLMEGEIRLESKPGNGTTVSIDIPFEVKQNPPEQNRAKQEVVPGQFSAKILLAEDDLVISQVSSEMIRYLGCECRIVENGQLAVEAFRKEPFDLVLLDFHMPVMNGLHAAREIRVLEKEMERNKTLVPIIAVTANVDVNTRQECLEVGMNDVLKKPFQMIDLQAILLLYAQQK